MQVIQDFKGLGIALLGALNCLCFGKPTTLLLFRVRQFSFPAAPREMRRKSHALYRLAAQAIQYEPPCRVQKSSPPQVDTLPRTLAIAPRDSPRPPRLGLKRLIQKRITMPSLGPLSAAIASVVIKLPLPS